MRSHEKALLAQIPKGWNFTLYKQKRPLEPRPSESRGLKEQQVYELHMNFEIGDGRDMGHLQVRQLGLQRKPQLNQILGLLPTRRTKLVCLGGSEHLRRSPLGSAGVWTQRAVFKSLLPLHIQGAIRRVRPYILFRTYSPCHSCVLFSATKVHGFVSIFYILFISKLTGHTIL